MIDPIANALAIDTLMQALGIDVKAKPWVTGATLKLKAGEIPVLSVDYVLLEEHIQALAAVVVDYQLMRKVD